MNSNLRLIDSASEYCPSNADQAEEDSLSKNSPGKQKKDASNRCSEIPLLTDLEDKAKKIPPTVCRICFSSCNQENLFAPCKCRGTIAYVHRNCLERWLETRNGDNCELCNFRFNTVKTKKPVWSWCLDPSARNDRRNLLGDIVCFLCLTPLGLTSFWLCLQGSLYFYNSSNALVEAISLMAVASFLSFAYFTWVIMSLRYHYTVWLIWRNRNWAVRVVWPEEGVGEEETYEQEGEEEEETIPGTSNEIKQTVSVPLTESSESESYIAQSTLNHVVLLISSQESNKPTITK